MNESSPSIIVRSVIDKGYGHEIESLIEGEDEYSEIDFGYIVDES